MSAPCSALWTALVTAKNSSLPWITCHSASIPRLAQQRHVGGEQLGDATAVGGGVDVEDPGAPQRLGQRPDALDRLDADDLRVVVEVLLEERDAFEHAEFLAVVLGDGSLGQSIDVMVSAAVACPDKFRGTLDAAAAAARDGRRVCARAGFDDVVEVPLADGGEGTLDALLARARRLAPSRDRHRTARRPGRRRVGAAPRRHRGGRDGARQRARARAADRNDPLRASSTRGTGELIAAAHPRRRARA